jgi:hypothetical protein
VIERRHDSLPPIFLVGLPRSGSTLVSRMLNSHPDLITFGEMHFLTPWRRDFRHFLKRSGDLADDRTVRRIVEGLFRNPPPAGLQRGPYFWKQIRRQEAAGLKEALLNRILQSEERTIGTIFRAVIEEATACRGGRRAVVKFPVYPVYMQLLREWWPEAKIIHLTRDPRAIAASKSNDPGGTARLVARYPWLERPLRFGGRYFAVLQYYLASRVHERFRGSPNYRLLQYESLVKNHESVIQELCEFCELPGHDAMLRPREGQASSITGVKSGGFDVSRVDGWKKTLAPLDAAIIKRLTRRSMARFEYHPAEEVAG